MPRKLPPEITVEVLPEAGRDIEQRLNELYLRMVRRQLLESPLTVMQRLEVLKGLKRVKRNK